MHRVLSVLRTEAFLSAQNCINSSINGGRIYSMLSIKIIGDDVCYKLMIENVCLNGGFEIVTINSEDLLIFLFKLYYK